MFGLLNKGHILLLYFTGQQCQSVGALNNKQAWLAKSKNTLDADRNSAKFAIDDQGIFGIDSIFASKGESLFEWLEVL